MMRKLPLVAWLAAAVAACGVVLMAHAGDIADRLAAGTIIVLAAALTLASTAAKTFSDINRELRDELIRRNRGG